MKYLIVPAAPGETRSPAGGLVGGCFERTGHPPLVRRPGGPISGHQSSNARWPHQAACELFDARTPSTTAGGRALVPRLRASFWALAR